MTQKAKTTGAVAVRKAGGADDRTPEQRVGLVRDYLDKLEAVQIQHATGAILIGLELLALKDQIGRGDFQRVFEEQIERPRFSLRSAQRYMQDAHRIRMRLLKSGHVSLAEVMDVAPSEMSIVRRKELTSLIGQAVKDNTLTGLRGALAQEKQRRLANPGDAAKAMADAHVQVWQEMMRRLTIEAIQRKSWKHLNEETRKIVRQHLQSALAEIPA